MRIGGVRLKKDPIGTYPNIPECENRAAVSGSKNGGQTFYSHIVIDKVNYTMQINDVLSINPVFFKAVTTENKYPFLLTQNETGEVNRVRDLDLFQMNSLLQMMKKRN